MEGPMKALLLGNFYWQEKEETNVKDSRKEENEE